MKGLTGTDVHCNADKQLNIWYEYKHLEWSAVLCMSAHCIEQGGGEGVARPEGVEEEVERRRKLDPRGVG